MLKRQTNKTCFFPPSFERQKKLAVFSLLQFQQLAGASSIYTGRTENVTKIGTDYKEKLHLLPSLPSSGLWIL